MLLQLARTSKTFNVRPSSLIGIADDVVAYDFDQAAACLLAIHEPDAGLVLKHALEGFTKGKRGDPPDADDFNLEGFSNVEFRG